MAATAYGHATFFLLAQDHAGQHRASSVKDAASDAPPRSIARDPAKIASDQATVQSELAWIDSKHCRENCERLNYRRVAESGRLGALNVEMVQSERQQRLVDTASAERSRVSSDRAAAAADPVTMVLAHLHGVDIGSLSLCLAVVLGLVVEGLGSLSWAIALAGTESEPRYRTMNNSIAAVVPGAVAHAPVATNGTDCRTDRDTRGEGVTHAATQMAQGSQSTERVTATDATPVPWSNDASNDGASMVNQILSVVKEDGKTETGAEDVVDELVRLRAGLEYGEVRATVASIRKYFRCSQRRAMELRRAFITADSLYLPSL